MTEDELINATLESAANDHVIETASPDTVSEPVSTQPVTEQHTAASYIGTKLTRDSKGRTEEARMADKNLADNVGLSKVGDNINRNVEARDGWIHVDKALLGERALYYPEDWEFMIRPATVEAIRNWSTIDEENTNNVDDVFNEILKSCLSIKTPTGPKHWGNIASWDRFFFLLLIREYTFVNGEQKIAYDGYCPNCEHEDVRFELNSASLMYDFPGADVLPMYNQAQRLWYIVPAEYDIHESPIQLFIPTLEKDANLKGWMISKLQQDKNYNFDKVFLRFVNWMLPKISKDTTVADNQIKKAHIQFKSWDMDMFSFMNSVIDNIIVTPSNKLTKSCEYCGEEVTSDIRFPGSIRDLFNVQHRFKKFGQK